MIAFKSTVLMNRSLTIRIDKLLFSKMFKLTEHSKLTTLLGSIMG
jgi:hypothetical protein